MIKVDCTLNDCLYYREARDKTGSVYCAHPDVLLHKDILRCPLYRLDWNKQAEAADMMLRRSDG